MGQDSLRGETIRWTFEDGRMAGKTFEHTFGKDGAVTFRELGGKSAGKPGHAERYETATLGDGVTAVAYLAPSGYTLTTVLDDRSGRLVAFASNDKELFVQHGTFERAGTA
jgi:hypothetical protein